MDQIFRWCVALGMAVLLPAALYFRVRSQRTREKLDRTREGWFVLLTLRPIAIVWIVSFAAYVIAPQSMAWSQIELPGGIRWGGLVLAVLGGFVLIWTQYTLGDNLTDTVVTREKAFLVTTGPYRWVRHPYYLGFLFAVVGNSVMAANWFLLLGGMLAFAIIIFRTPTEEKFLVERFGQAYLDYREKTGMLFPRIRRQ